MIPEVPANPETVTQEERSGLSFSEVSARTKREHLARVMGSLNKTGFCSFVCCILADERIISFGLRHVELLYSLYCKPPIYMVFWCGMNELIPASWVGLGKS